MLRDTGKSKIHKLSLSKKSVSLRSLGIPLINKLHLDSEGYKEGLVTQRNKNYDSTYKRRCTNILESLQPTHKLKEKYQKIKDGFLVRNKNLKLWKLDNELVDL